MCILRFVLVCFYRSMVLLMKKHMFLMLCIAILHIYCFARK